MMDISFREHQIWAPFLHKYPPTTVDAAETQVIRMLIWSHSYRAGYKYLIRLTDWQLTMLAEMHSANMGRLDAEHQALLIDLGARLYLKRIDIAIKDARLPIREAKLNAERAEVQARIDALEADRAQLLVLQTKIDRARADAEARIAELTAQIEMEMVRRSEIDVEEAQTKLQKAETELQIVEAALFALEYQLGVTDAAIDLLLEDVNQAKTSAQNAGLEADIAGKELIGLHQSIEQARLAADEAALDADESRQDAAEARDTADQRNLEADQFRQEILFPIEASISADDVAEMIARLNRALTNIHKTGDIGSAQSNLDSAQITDAVNRILEQVDAAQHQSALTELSDDFKDRLADQLLSIRETLASHKLTIESTQQTEATFNADHVIAVAELLATANISNQLMHRIGTV